MAPKKIQRDEGIQTHDHPAHEPAADQDEYSRGQELLPRLECEAQILHRHVGCGPSQEKHHCEMRESMEDSGCPSVDTTVGVGEEDEAPEDDRSETGGRILDERAEHLAEGDFDFINGAEVDEERRDQHVEKRGYESE